MAKETRPNADDVTLRPDAPELAATELAGSDGDRTRTGPRVIEREPRAHARTVGRFRIDAQLGSGGMGDVFRAYDTVLDRAVALKVLRTERTADDGQRMRRVIREARAAAALVHPNAVTVFDVGEADDEVFIAMELLDGEDLRAVLERGGSTMKERLRWLLEAARALSAAHERGLVHRDVKPENMFICKGGTLKLLDFGIAKRDEDDAPEPDAAALSVGPSSLRTTEGRRVGTPRYMAPEQHASTSTDARTDEYAWGLVAFELLTGAHVTTDARTMTRDGEGDSPATADVSERLALLRAKAPELPAATAEAIARALEPRKEDRFPSMAPLVAELESALEAASSTRDAPAPPTSAARAVSADATTRTAPATTRPRLFVGLAIAVAAVIAALVVARRRPHETGASAQAPAVCRVDSTRTLAVSPNDRVAVLPSGAVVVARDIKSGVLLERDGPDGGMDPILRTPMLAGLAGSYDDLGLIGTTYDAKPAVFFELLQGSRGAAISVADDKTMFSTRRIFGMVNGLAVAPVGRELAVIAVTRGPAAPFGPGSAVRAFVLGARALQPANIELAAAEAPVIATRGERVAVAYTVGNELHFAFLDPNLDRIGDVMKVADTNGNAALAFGGDTVAAFWTDASGPKTRLTVASLAPGQPAFSAPRVALDEPLAPRAPVTARLPDDSWVVAWVASTGGLTSLRVARVGPGASLSRPAEITSARAVDRLRAAPTDRGIDYWWYEDDKTVRIAKVSCGP